MLGKAEGNRDNNMFIQYGIFDKCAHNLTLRRSSVTILASPLRQSPIELAGFFAFFDERRHIENMIGNMIENGSNVSNRLSRNSINQKSRRKGLMSSGENVEKEVSRFQPPADTG